MIRLDEDYTNIAHSEFPGDVAAKGIVRLVACSIRGDLTAEDEGPEFIDCFVHGHIVHPKLANVTNCIAYDGNPKGTPRLYAVRNPLHSQEAAS